MRCRSSAFEYSLVPAVLASCAAFTSTYPLDSFKIQTQTDKLNKNSNLFAGYGEGLCICIGTAIVYFNLYAFLAASCEHVPIRAAIATCFSCLIKVPGKSITKQLQNQDFATAGEAVRETVDTLGIQGFYRSLGPYLLSDIPENALRFWLYSFLANYFQSTLVIGLVAGVVISLAVQPMDMLQTQVICNYKDKLDLGKLNLFKGTVPALLSNCLQTTIFVMAHGVFAQV